MKILYNVGSAYQVEAEERRLKLHYGIYNGVTQLAGTVVGYEGFTSLGNSDYNNELNFSLSDATTMDIASWTDEAYYYRPGWNLIEITKL